LRILKPGYEERVGLRILKPGYEERLGLRIRKPGYEERLGLRILKLGYEERLGLRFHNPSHTSHLPTYEDGTQCSETSAYKIHTPGNYPEGNIQRSEQGDSLKF